MAKSGTGRRNSARFLFWALCIQDPGVLFRYGIDGRATDSQMFLEVSEPARLGSAHGRSCLLSAFDGLLACGGSPD